MGRHATIAPDMAVSLDKGKISGTIRPQLIHPLTGRPYVPICESHPRRDSSSAILFLLSHTHEFVRSWCFPRSVLFPTFFSAVSAALYFSLPLPFPLSFPLLTIPFHRCLALSSFTTHPLPSPKPPVFLSSISTRPTPPPSSLSTSPHSLIPPSPKHPRKFLVNEEFE